MQGQEPHDARCAAHAMRLRFRDRPRDVRLTQPARELELPIQLARPLTLSLLMEIGVKHFGYLLEHERPVRRSQCDPLQTTVRGTPIGYADDLVLIHTDDFDERPIRPRPPGRKVRTRPAPDTRRVNGTASADTRSGDLVVWP